MTRSIYQAVLASALAVSSWALPVAAEEPATTYDGHVLPIFRAHCVNCHNADKAKGGLDLSTYSGLISGGSSGPVVLPGDPDGSRLYQVMAHITEPFMPQNAAKRPDTELSVLRKWIAGGLLEFAGDQPKKPATPRVSIALSESPDFEPDGPPPMPEESWLEPFVTSPRGNTILALAASPWAPLVAIGGHRQVVLYHAETHELLNILSFDEGQPYHLSFSRNGSLLLAAGGVGGQSGRVALWRVDNGERIGTVGDELDAILTADLSPDQKFLAVGGTDKRIKVFNLQDGGILHNIKQHTDWVTAVAYSPDGVLLATGDRNNSLLIWESVSGQEFHKLKGHGASITGLSWRRDSNVLASSSEDGNIKLWDMNTGDQIRNLGAGGAVLDLDFAKDGRLASVARNKEAKIWNAENLVQTIRGFSDLPTRCVFTHDGTRLVVGDWTGRVSLWNVEDGAHIADLRSNPPTLDERAALLGRERDEAQASLEQKVASVSEKQQKIQGLEQEIASLRIRTTSAENARDGANKKIAKAKEILKEAEETRAQADATLAQLSGAIPEKENREKTARAELQQIEEDRKSAEAVLAQKNRDLQRWEAEITRHAELRAEREQLPESSPQADQAPPEDPFSVPDEVVKIFSSRCYDCHGAEKQKGSLRLDSPAAILAGGESGRPPVVSADPDESRIIQLVTLPPDDVDIMPPKGDPLTTEQIQILRNWVQSL